MLSMRPEAIEQGTGRPWADWLELLEREGAQGLPHKEIAQRIAAEGASPWWAQSLTVAYEQYIGRRDPGQSGDGDYSVSVSKSRVGSMDEALERWVSLTGGREEFSDVPITRAPETSSTDSWRYWRCGLADGTRVTVSIHEKFAGKAALAIQHDRLESEELIEHWRAFWKSVVRDL